MRLQTLKRYLAGAALSLFALCAKPVFAQNYSGNCAGVSSWNGQGNAVISQSGACTISQALTATGYITITATGNIQTGAINSGSYIGVSTTGGTISTGALNSNQGGSDGDILLMATGNIGTGAISTNGGAATGGVEIDANIGNATGTVFTIGGSNANGVASINTSNTTGGGTNPAFITGGINVTNGSSTATGGITVAGMSDIQVNSSGGRSGIISLNAQNGTLTLPAGELNADGTSSAGAGTIYLQAKTLTTANGTIISASQPLTSSFSAHDVLIAAQTVNVTGSSGLQIHADGTGYPSDSLLASAGLFPEGAFTITSNQNLSAGLLWTPSATTFANKSPVTVAGTGAPITITANGEYDAVYVTGYPIAFTNGAVTLESNGSYTHQVWVEYSGSLTGTTGLTLSGNGAVTIEANGVNSGDTGGQVYVVVDQATISAPSFMLHADGVGTGAAGYIDFVPSCL